jgi:hypothetical protein
MTDNDRAELGTLLTQALGFYGQTLSSFALEVWWAACRNLEVADVRRALTAHALDPDRGHFAPKPADVVRQLHGDTNEQALVAWGQVMAAARSGGAKFDGAIQQAIDSMGGMGRIRLANESENGFLQSQFVAAFKAYNAAQTRERAMQIGGAEVRKIGRVV